MGSALLNQIPQDESAGETTAGAGTSSEALRQQVAARLADHRSRRARAQADTSMEASGPPATRPAEGTHKSRIAATVAERYAQAQSYRAFLAAEAERALLQARAAAEIAARNAQAVAEARQQLLDTLAREQEPDLAPAVLGYAEERGFLVAAEPMLWPDLEALRVSARKGTLSGGREGDARTASKARRGRQPSASPAAAELGSELGPALRDAVLQDGGVRVVLYEELQASGSLRSGAALTRSADQRQDRNVRARHTCDDAEALALDEEISFRHAPVFEEPAGPPMPLPANLIEFPRQLIASRKARPRYAEGPLREEDAGPAEGGQLRIFEVDPSQISIQPEALEAGDVERAQWSSLWLDTPPAVPAYGVGERAAGEQGQAHAEGAFAQMTPPPRPQTAALGRRALSCAIDLGLIGVATLAFTASFAAIAGHLADPAAAWSPGALVAGAGSAVQGLPLLSGVIAAGMTAGVLALAYQLLFFTFSECTPGMRLARIGLCTFSDGNPTRRAMRLRIFALVLSTVTLGFGHLWALLDEDRLTWQDLISRMYPRSY